MPEKILGSELPEDAFELLNKGTTVVVATVDEDGYPRTAPIALVAAPNRKTLRVCIRPHKFSYKNIVRNGKVMVCVIGEGNIAIGVKGRAEVINEDVGGHPTVPSPIVEIRIEEVKSDALPWAPIMHGIRTRPIPEKRPDKLSPEIRRKIRDALKK